MTRDAAKDAITAADPRYAHMDGWELLECRELADRPSPEMIEEISRHTSETPLIVAYIINAYRALCRTRGESSMTRDAAKDAITAADPREREDQNGFTPFEYQSLRARLVAAVDTDQEQLLRALMSNNLNVIISALELAARAEPVAAPDSAAEDDARTIVEQLLFMAREWKIQNDDAGVETTVSSLAIIEKAEAFAARPTPSSAPVAGDVRRAALEEAAQMIEDYPKHRMPEDPTTLTGRGERQFESVCRVFAAAVRALLQRIEAPRPPAPSPDVVAALASAQQEADLHLRDASTLVAAVDAANERIAELEQQVDWNARLFDEATRRAEDSHGEAQRWSLKLEAAERRLAEMREALIDARQWVAGVKWKINGEPEALAKIDRALAASMRERTSRRTCRAASHE